MHIFTRSHSSQIAAAFLSFVAATLLWSGPTSAGAQKLVAARTADTFSELDLVDVGPVPISQPIHLTLRLTTSGERSAALDQLLINQNNAISQEFHRWLTPKQFAESYGPSTEQLVALTQWLASQGFAVENVSPARTRIQISGTAEQIENAFQVTIRNYSNRGAPHYVSSNLPTMPSVLGSVVAEISGLDDIPSTSSTEVAAVSSKGIATILTNSEHDVLDALSAAVEGNLAPVLTVTSTDCTITSNPADYESYRALYRQASAQGITVIASTNCPGTETSAGASGNLADVTSITTKPLTQDAGALEPRPGWQAAHGLPPDGLRHTPDLAVNSAQALARTVSSIVEETGMRQGNINSTLYSLASTPGLYMQESGEVGTWESTVGLGTINLETLAKVYPRATGTISTTTSLVADSYAVKYGTPITLTASLLPSSYGASNPTGTVSFTSASGAIGSAQLNNGKASFTIGNLDVGTYNVMATYSGDSVYAGSASTSSVIITVSIVNATVATTVAPVQNVPYGATATVTATVTLPTSSASPNGSVTAQIQAVTNSVSTATLSPNPGGNSATANIVLNAPPPGGSPYTIETTCAGNQNFQCQSPALVKNFTVVKGYTTTTVTTSPQSPQAGEPISLTATINNSGNGVGTYNFSGNVTFYDNGTILATAPVATNTASTSKSLSGNVQHSITAKYSGDANWNPSTSAPQSVQPTLLPATLTLSSNTATTLAGVNFILTATVYTTATSSIGPTGNVAFYDTFNGSVLQLGSARPVTPNGPSQSIAMFTTTGLLAGAHSIYAVYTGDANFTTATSVTLPISVADFTITKIPQTLTLKAGQTGKAVMLIGGIGGFAGTVTFGCTPPAGTQTTCSFNPVTVNGGGSTTMQIVTAAGTTKLANSRKTSWSIVDGTAFAVLCCLILPKRRLLTLLFVVTSSSLVLTSGCGLGKVSEAEGGATSPGESGTPLGTQTFIITSAGSDGINTVRHTDQLQVTIQ